MARFCTNCGTPLTEGAKYCTKCGAPVPAETTQSVPVPNPVPAVPEEAASVPVAADQPAPTDAKADGTQKREKKKKRNQDTNQPEKTTRERKRPDLTPGAVILAACLAMECLPYLLKSLIFMARKGPFSNILCNFLDVLGFAAAGAVLFFGGKYITQKGRFPAAVLFTALWGGIRVADLVIMSRINLLEEVLPVILAALDVLVFLIFPALAAAPLCDLFSGKGKCRRRGMFTAYLLLLAAAVLMYYLPVLWMLTPLNGFHSFFGTIAFRFFAALLEAGLLNCAVNRMLKRLGEEKGPIQDKLLTPAGIFGTVLAVSGIAGCFIGNAAKSVPDAVLNDVEVYLIQGEFRAAAGNVNQLLLNYEQAAEHCDAWRQTAAGNGYSVPYKFAEDRLLQYLSHINDSGTALRKYLALNLDESETELWGPLMLMRYREQEKNEALNEAEQAHRTEILEMCLANNCFVSNYPLPDELTKNKAEIEHQLNADDRIQEKIEIASVLAAAERGEINGVNAVNSLLELAEKYPQNMNLQLVAGYITSQNTWDGNDTQCDRAVKALRHYTDMWENTYGADATKEERLDMNRSIGGMMKDMGAYTDAVSVYETIYADAQDDIELLQSLSYCYSMTNNQEKGYELGKKLYAASPDNAEAIWSFAVSALKQGQGAEAAEAAAKLAELVRTDLGTNEDGRDELLYNLVLYIALNDHDAWTDYQYRIYNGEDDTDPDVLEELQKNEFFYNYVRAVYFEKTKNDQEQALPYAKAALAAQEASGRLWFLNGIIYFDAKQYPEAIQAYEQADRLENDDATIQFALANAYDAAGEYELALEYCDKALAHFPNGVDHSTDFYGVSGHVGNLRSAILRHMEG